jgi:hypothetical protein
MNFDAARPFIAKFVAPLIGFVITYLNKKFGIAFSDAETAQLVASLVDLVVFAMATGISAVAINKRVNPANAATTPLAVAGKEINEDEKRLQQATKEYAARKAGVNE